MVTTIRTIYSNGRVDSGHSDRRLSADPSGTRYALFGELPQAKPPSVISAGDKSIVHCADCKGSGRRRYTAASGDYLTQRHSEPCAKCDGGGWVMSKRRKSR